MMDEPTRVNSVLMC